MYKIFIIFCICGTIFADDEESNEKYIDLLPEEEKQEFLNRIARRILEGINSGDTPNQSHVEISDDQLNEHHAYVQDIINEESQNLKNERRKDASSTEYKHIDLTLRDGKRDKRKNDDQMQLETTSEPDYSVIPVKTVYGEDYNGGPDAKNFKNENIENIEVEKDIKLFTNTSQDMSMAESVTEQEDIEISHIDNNNASKGLNNNDTQFNKTADFEPNFIKNTSESNVDYEITTPIGENTSNNIVDNKTPWDSTQKSHLSVENEKFDDDKSLSNALSTTEVSSVTTDLHSETIASTINTESVTEDSIIKTTLSSAIGNFSDVDRGLTFQRRGSGNLNETYTSIINKETHTTTISPLIIPNVSRKIGTTIKEDIKESIADDGSFTKIEQNVSTDSFNVEDSKSSLRQRSYLFDSESEISKVNVATPKSEYKVYEIAAKKPPFTLLKHNHEMPYKQPNYVPIYNYAPEHAYFKPNNRFEHSKKEEGSYERNLRTEIDRENDFKLDIPETSRFFGHNKINSYTINENYPIKNDNSKLFQFLKPQKKVFNQDINYNPYDYLDLDYNINRNENVLRSRYDGRQKFPNSDESDHPINMYKSENVKNHIRAVRKLMYLQNIFGPLIENLSIRKSDPQPKNHMNEKELDDMITKGISVDYYFGRIHSDEDVSLNSMIPNILKIKKHSADPENTYSVGNNRFLERYNLVPATEIDEYSQGSIGFSSLFQAMITILKDVIMFDNNVLKSYAWLPTTVELQSTIRTLLDTLYNLKTGNFVSRKHLELFKYVIYLHEVSKKDLEERLVQPETYSNHLQYRYRKKHKKHVLPQNKRRKKLKQPLIMWRDFAKYIRNEHDIENDKINMFDEFEDFLQNLLNNLQDFHEAVKNIAGITTHRTQNWFEDLKNIYFNKASRKQLGQVVLHFSLVNLLDKIKKDSKNGVDVNYRSFIKNNKADVERTKEDFIFVSQVLYELNRI